jgi:hypothetical protein
MAGFLVSSLRSLVRLFGSVFVLRLVTKCVVSIISIKDIAYGDM